MDGVSRVVGTCETMCPIEEFKMRQREGLLHKLELPCGRKPVGRGRARLRGDISYAVKEYSRPAAGRADPDPVMLRPPRVLHQTLHYLFSNLISKQHVQDGEWNVVYDFVFDRLRAVRQDMVIQEISGQDAITILETCVRFHVYAAYRLCEHNMDTFDPVINFQHTQECLKRLLYLYKQTDSGQMEDADTDNRHSCSERHEDSHGSQRLRHCVRLDPTDSSESKSDLDDDGGIPDIGSLSIHDTKDSILQCKGNGGRLGGCSGTDKHQEGHRNQTEFVKEGHRNQTEFECVYLLCNLGDSDAIRHFLNLPKSIRCDPLSKLTYQMSISYLLGNTLRVVRLASRLTSVLALCAFHRHLTSVQSHGMRMMCTAYSSKNTRFPVSRLTQLLAYDADIATERACRERGLQVQDGKVCFLKSSYIPQEKTKPSRWEYLEGKLSSVSVSDLLLGSTTLRT